MSTVSGQGRRQKFEKGAAEGSEQRCVYVALISPHEAGGGGNFAVVSQLPGWALVAP